jgi:hypothetical protein
MTVSERPAGVGLRVVEKIDAVLVGGLHQVGGDVVADLLTERDPRSQ